MSLTLKLSFAHEFKEEMKLSQIIRVVNLMAVPDEVLINVIGEIYNNSENVETKLQEIKKENISKGTMPDNQVQVIYSSLISSKGNFENKKGFISSPDLRTLENCVDDYKTAIVTPDATLIGRKNEKPEIVFSDYLKGSRNLRLMQVDAFKYPETARLFYQLRNFEDWKKSKLLEAYPIIGDVQREYFEEFDSRRFSILNQENLAEKLDISDSTVSRLLSNRLIEARNIYGEEKSLYSKDLLKTKDDVKKYKILPLINKVFLEEFEIRKAYSDRIIKEKLNGRIKTRTISKYRLKAKVPGTPGRNKGYKDNSLQEPYQMSQD